MSWLRVDDGFHNHPKILAAGNRAAGLFVRLGSYCAQHSTNGHVPMMIAKSYGAPGELRTLVDCHLIEPCEDGYRLHDYLDYNPSADKIRAERAEAAERKRRQRARSE